jgi:type I restriction enzyme M protein
LEAAEKLAAEIGDAEYLDFNEFRILVSEAVESLGLELSSFELKQILGAVSVREEKAAKVVKKIHALSGKKLAEALDELGTTQEHLADYGYWPGKEECEYIEYESDSELRDTENVSLDKDPERAASEVIHDYFLEEVRPHVADAWIDLDKTVIGYEISFNKYYYQHKALRSLEEVSAEILALEAETEGMLKDLIKFVGKQS